ncbi:cell filamentation protein [Granulicella rosea]|uniref:protein adenylyltransferase n=1 Tax=Granulicella rosea TaxID=474952 RepID=A0A239LMN1_9BACT|nr:Fic family protein [Granulicella rosea]SNT30929.1 cell filamentation protein [Granulicella rosea]
MAADRGFASDPHSERGFPCPKNRFGITDYAELHEIETSLGIKRAGELRDRGVTGKFDIPHLQSIHKYLFQDVFPWAGEFRVVNISKGNSNFGPAMHIHGALDDALGKLKREGFLVNLSPKDFATRAAFYLGEINAIHPFREGNGRAQREFIRQLGVHAGHSLSWAGFTQQAMIDASIASLLSGDNGQLATIVEAALFSSRAMNS